MLSLVGLLEITVMPEPLLAHNVFFTLIDNSPAAVQKLLTACKKHLTVQAGIVHFACGKLEAGLAREVNDRGFDVGLHIVFATRAAHDAYQSDPQHQRFIAENKANWKLVRVFDSLVEAVTVKT
jgi:Stress responsive A/B Barrel Domain